MARSEKIPFWIKRVIWIAILVALIAWFLDYNARAPSRFDNASWFDGDPMSFSGFLAVIVGIGYSIMIDRSQTRLLTRWHDAAIIDLEPDTRAEIENALWRRSLAWQGAITGVLVILMIIGYANFFSFFDPFSEFSIASFVCAFLVGLRLARLVSHGLIGQLIERRKVPFGMTIEHPDRTGGTAKIGFFYFLQASVMTVPVLWLLIWMLLIPSVEGYASWADHFFYLLLLAVFVFVLAFLLPMTAFRRVIRDWKRANVSGAVGEIRNELLKLRLIENPTSNQRQQRAQIAQQLDDLIHLPDWPISPATRNMFVTTFMLPLVVNVVTNATT